MSLTLFSIIFADYFSAPHFIVIYYVDGFDAVSPRLYDTPLMLLSPIFCFFRQYAFDDAAFLSLLFHAALRCWWCCCHFRRFLLTPLPLMFAAIRIFAAYAIRWCFSFSFALRRLIAVFRHALIFAAAAAYVFFWFYPLIFAAALLRWCWLFLRWLLRRQLPLIFLFFAAMLISASCHFRHWCFFDCWCFTPLRYFAADFLSSFCWFRFRRFFFFFH